jgi:polysaccharide pyruvyl transferase CsaB
MRRYRVALAGYYGFGNLGDELLAKASIAALLRRGVERERIVILSNDPGDSRRRFGVETVNRWNRGQVLKILRQSETFLLGGGGLFQDVTSLRSCVYYWGLVRSASLTGAVPWALGQSVGPFATSWGRRLARGALRRCRVVQVRDKASLSLCENWGLPAELGHDLVFSLGGALRAIESGGEGAIPPLLVNLRPVGKASNDLPGRFAEAVGAYTRAPAGEGARSSLTSSPIVGVALSDDDERLMRRLADRGLLELTRVERVTTLSDAARVFRGAKAAAGMRLHFAVLAAMAGVPLVVVPYDTKVEAFASCFGVPLWREGPLPLPGIPASSPSADAVCREIDDLCRQVLERRNP